MNKNHLYETESAPDMRQLLRLVLAVLIVLIFATAILIVKQTQARHQAYIELQKLNRELTKLKIEEQRLMIEQQTFSATPQVAQRAVTELGMFFPNNDNRRVIAPNAKPSSQASE
ncbi:cell division protein FtsL [Moraxella cuniculi DSM 21768]|uniref:Cell division protein FtsL n=2 Tax=Moraxella cuniculi TaxID=34061 RepID=A0A1N7DQN0_9GAMM|nr:cell division protein FtsL [Moraxella cuniculi]OOS05990.1 cell division protein FtsL [Moraxella cuniculi]SIR77995.1 cell division protein FtsL [Moraxella cuniculi DSM 21768]VEG12704.1 Cell division protein [Moraxella cuniculi]